MSDTTEDERKATEHAWLYVEAEADAMLAKAPEFAQAIGRVAAYAPEPVRSRVVDQCDAMVRQAAAEGMLRGFLAGKTQAASDRCSAGRDDGAAKPNREAAPETIDIANDLMRLVTRRIAEGAAAPTVAAGLALGLTELGREASGKLLVAMIGACLTSGDPAGHGSQEQ